MVGMGVMIGQLGGNAESAAAIAACVGRTIESANLVSGDPDVVVLSFVGGTKLHISDEGQSCCEHRHITEDGNLTELAGEKFYGLEVRDGPETVGKYDEVNECQFVHIQTDGLGATLTTHNEHNGYYGGFWLVARAVHDAP